MRSKLFLLFLMAFSLLNAQDWFDLKNIDSLKVDDKFEEYSVLTGCKIDHKFLYNNSTKKAMFIQGRYAGFKYGMLHVKIGGENWCLMRLNGQRILEKCHYIKFFEKQELISAVICNKGWIILNFKGDTIKYEKCSWPYEAPEVDGPIFAAKSGQTGHFGYLNLKGEWIIKPVYRQARPFINDQAKVLYETQSGEKWGLIDTTGKFIIEPKFETEEFDPDVEKDKK